MVFWAANIFHYKTKGKTKMLLNTLKYNLIKIGIKFSNINKMDFISILY